ncbi:M24 family metallopeptidase [Erwiniaceae bacterium BAC15a-03b]|uniref:M24 family metallopeptidase n=1 Tax=Winslowiella arboricola TaxID=2978220 RepID=A0A9J6PJP0_9GAMM|nr:aminopeptidase P family protein [Winslowiella arboricola]MCU5771751.1 M24 family metallopeptidase [Winslowiella arboricola]MCU5777578.1 M24 family metallopeptidase [Winslowiella arboricola]
MTNGPYQLRQVPQPQCYPDLPSVPLSDHTIQQRLTKVLQSMRRLSLDALVIYADKEHGANFEYLSGFIPRFEEALLLLNADGRICWILGNENLKLAAHARLPGDVLHSPWFSLPNQPMQPATPLYQLLQTAGIGAQQRVGLAGWKLFTGPAASNDILFDVPHFICQALQQALSADAQLVNATGLFISPQEGVRTTNNANEIAHYEYGANLASTAILRALNAIEPGKSEKQIGALLAAEGQANNVIMIAATGDRFEHASLYPGDKKIAHGDKFSLTTSYKGGLSSRAAYVVAAESELPAAVADYLQRVAQPYYHAVVSWLEHIQVGVTGGEIYQLIEQVLPKSAFHWHLNPGHLVADEEWLCSPVYPHSDIALASGMLLQIDIIPSVAGYGGASIEDTIALADRQLRAQLAADYPALWQRICKRRAYLKEVLHLDLHDDLLPLSNTVGYLRPFLLDKNSVLARQK